MKKNIITLTLAALFVGNVCGGVYDGMHYTRGNEDGSPQVELQTLINKEAKQYHKLCIAKFFKQWQNEIQSQYNKPAKSRSPFDGSQFPEAYANN